MARYYEEIALIEFVKKYTPHINGETTMECVERAIRNAPTAEVVPKSEYDAVVSALDNSTQEFLKLHDDYQEAKREVEKLREINSLLTEAGQEWQQRYNNAKAEVVREIDAMCIDFFGNFHYERYAELKKKYTEKRND